jgi:site-specific DNA-methyltransferase (adenine-specific)
MDPDKPIVEISDLVLDDRNCNRGTDRGRELLQASLRKYGAGRSVLVDRYGRIVAGNKTALQAAALGLPIRVIETDGRTLVVVKRQDLDLTRDKAARELAIADNRVGELDLNWDVDAIRSLLDDGVELEPFFLPGELAHLFGEDFPPGAEEPGPPPLEKAVELQGKWSTAHGQVWTIQSGAPTGKSHRLMCGDSTKTTDVDRLAAGQRAVFLFTDPPYGVEYVGKTLNALTIENDGREGVGELLDGAFREADRLLVDGAPFYVCHPAGPVSLEFGRAVLDIGWRFHQSLVWVKDVFVLGHSDHHYKHEPILYGWKGKNRRWYGGRDQTSVLEFPRPKVSDLHPTVKPTELVAHCLRNSSRAGDVGYEPFSGSGTTLVAAEQMGRICLAMEIDPKYVAVALERLSLLGLKPCLEAS